MKEGDKNTTYFHMMASSRRTNHIAYIQVGDQYFHKEDDIRQYTFDYYTSLFSKEEYSRLEISEELLPRLSPAESEG